MNTLCRYWPSKVAIAIVDYLRTIHDKGDTFASESLQWGLKFLYNIHPFYRLLLSDKTAEQKKDYICSFFAGACGFYNLCRLWRFGEKQIDNSMLTAYLGTEAYNHIMEQCGSDEDDLMADAFFGDYVRSFRLIELVFRTITDSDIYKQEADEKTLLADIQEHLRSALRLCYLIYEAPAELEKEGQTEDNILSPYLSHCLTKERAENPVLFIKFASYNRKLIKAQFCECENIQVVCLYDAVKGEMDHIATAVLTKKLYIQKCRQCGDFYLDSVEINRSREGHKSYCSTACRNLAERWTARFQAYASAIKSASPKGYLPEMPRKLIWVLRANNCLKTINDKLHTIGMQAEEYETAYYILLTALYLDGAQNMENEYTIAAYTFLTSSASSIESSCCQKLCFGSISNIQNYLKECNTPKRLEMKCREKEDLETDQKFISEVIRYRKKEQRKYERDRSGSTKEVII